MDIDQIETFLAVVSFGGVHRAAEALRLSQPAVSSRIKALEEFLGVRLFTRGRGRLTLSPAGLALKPHAEQLLRATALMQQAVTDLQPVNSAALHIAAALSICTYFLPDVLNRFSKEHPNVAITVCSASSSSKEVLEMILNGKAEIGLARSLYHPEVEKVVLRTDHLILVGDAASRPARKRRARLEEIATWPLILFDQGSTDWTLTYGIFRRAGLVPNVVLDVEVIETAKRMVERGLGLAFLPELAVVQEIRQGKLIPITIVDAEPMSRTMDAIYLRRLGLKAEANAFLQVAKDVAKQIPNYLQAGKGLRVHRSSGRRSD
jgi:DNA-binding transcriptional LysR family regulator